MATNGDDSSLNAVSMKLPAFWPHDPALWFHQVEAQFSTRNITQQMTKFNHVVGSLAPETATEVRDIIFNVPTVDPYIVLKERLITRTSMPQIQRMQSLLSLPPLGDLRPSQLLRRIEQLADKKLEDPMYVELFLSRLPESVRLILRAQEGKSLYQLAELADNLSASQLGSSNAESGHCNLSAIAGEDIASLRAEIVALRRQMNKSRASKDFKHTRNSDSLCWYHARFGGAAKTCKPPCTRSGNASLDL